MGDVVRMDGVYSNRECVVVTVGGCVKCKLERYKKRRRKKWKEKVW